MLLSEALVSHRARSVEQTAAAKKAGSLVEVIDVASPTSPWARFRRAIGGNP